MTNYRVVTLDSLVFGGWRDAAGAISFGSGAGAPAIMGVATAHAIMMWHFYQLLPGTPLPGVITGKVLRVKWGSPGDAPQYQPVVGAMVTGSDAGGIALLSNGGTFARTDANGTFALEDRFFTGGQVTVTATDDRGVPRRHHRVPDERRGHAQRGAWRYNVAKANIIFPAGLRRLLRRWRCVSSSWWTGFGRRSQVWWLRTRLCSSPSNKDLEIRNDGIQINDRGRARGASRSVDSWNPQEEAPTYLLRDNSSQDGLFVPGTWVHALRIKVMRSTSPEPFYVTYTFRAVTAGGEWTSIGQPPGSSTRVRFEGQCARRAGGVTPQLSFTGPVKRQGERVSR